MGLAPSLQRACPLFESPIGANLCSIVRPTSTRAITPSSLPPLVLPAVRGRPRHHRALRSSCSSRGFAAETSAPAIRLPPSAPHFAPKAKRVIFLFMAGAPAIWNCSTTSPSWPKFDGTLPPPELLKGYRAAFINPNSKLLGPKFKFARHGQCGAELSELLPHLAEVVDDIAIVKSMATDAFNHAPARS